jgi:hypothetical protein
MIPDFSFFVLFFLEDGIWLEESGTALYNIPILPVYPFVPHL